MKDRFYLACFRDNVGENVGWHCVDGQGYSTDVSKAHTYTREQAQQKWDLGREYDQPISADHVDALTVWKVDHQYIAMDSQISESVNAYVVFVKRRWNGNDVFWLNKRTLTTSLNFEKATTFTLAEVQDLLSEPANNEKYIAIPYQDAEKAKRRTFSSKSFNAKTMVQGAGLVIPKRIKNARRRKANPKHLFNCPSCGKLNWQYNPYDFEGCNHNDCSYQPSRY